MPFNYELENYRLHSISKIEVGDNGNLKAHTVDLSEGLAIEKNTSHDHEKPAYIVIAFLKPSKDAAGCLEVEFVTERITEIKDNEFSIFMELYYRAHRAIFNKESIYASPTEEEIAKIKIKSNKEVTFVTKCLICGEKIEYPARDWYDSKDHISPYVKVCDSCKKVILDIKKKEDKE